MNILGRRHWGAKASTGHTSQNPDEVDTLVVHHTAGKRHFTKAAAAREMRSIQRQHMDAQGWSDIGYNVVIDSWGRCWEGRGLFRVGAHTYRQNTGTIGVSFMGNYENYRLTKRQIKAFNDLKLKLKAHGIKVDRIRGHRDMPNQATACPGKHVMKQLNL